MASIYKKRIRKPLPKEAEVVIRRDRRIVRWTDGRGRKQEAVLSEDGRHVILESPVWHARYRDHDDIVRRASTRCRDKQLAEKVLSDMLAREDKIRSRIIRPDEARVARYARQPIGQHIEAYLEHLRNKTTRGRKTSPVHVANVRRQLRRLVSDLGFVWATDVAKNRIARWMNRQADMGQMSGRTINTYRAAIMAFCQWAVSEGRLASNPLEGLHTADETEKRRERRALTADEIALLLEEARARPLRDAMTIRRGPRKGQIAANLRWEAKDRLIALGHERALLYQCMIYTGLRRGELADLTVSNIHLDAPRPFLEVMAGSAKNARADQIPLRTDLADQFRSWVSCKLPDAKVFKVPRDLREILYRDLRAAGIPRIDERGRQLDVHGLRHTTATQLARSGVLPQVAMRIMRHSSIQMTMKHYTHLGLTDTGRAVEMLPDFENHSLATGAESRTGTDDGMLSGVTKMVRKSSLC